MRGKICGEITPSGRSTCVKCKQIINKGSYRIVETIGSGRWQKVNKYCRDCGCWLLIHTISELSYYFNELEKK
jgi:hypothetical protein